MFDIQRLIEKAEATNDRELYAQVGIEYYLGEKVALDKQAAFYYMKKAADLGHIRAKFHVGYMYYRAVGVEKNCPAAKRYLTDAADGGDIDALVQLGWMCYNNEYSFFAAKGKAFTFWKKASKLGHPQAQIYVATSYLTDDWGAEQSYKKAAFWFMCAYQNRKSTKKQIAEAKEMLHKLEDRVCLSEIKSEIAERYPNYINL